MAVLEKFPPIIELNVGGRHFVTTLQTLNKHRESMLGAMFSGNYEALKDKDGRYFIDADGRYFEYILNYLRHGELPPRDIAKHVYHDAVYFGITELARHIERYPIIMEEVQRENLRTKIIGYHNAIEDLIDQASKSGTGMLTTKVHVLLIGRKPTDVNPEHRCHPAVGCKIGPWGIKLSNKDVMKCLSFDLKQRGYTITHEVHEGCSTCESFVYVVEFHWWTL